MPAKPQEADPRTAGPAGRAVRWLPCILLTVASTSLAVWWTASGRTPVTGDEPHYLIIAASVVRDFDFDVANNYEHDAAVGEISQGALRPHALRRGPRLWPQHMPGLGVLLAVPFGLGGTLGARAGLALLVVPLLAAVVYRWSRTCLPPPDAALATFGVLACSPVVFGASQAYPDLPAGALAVALAAWLWSRARPARPEWCLYWLAAGLLCWLHVKYYAPSALLAALGAWRLWRDRAAPFTPAAYATFGILYLAGPALFSAFSISAFGNLLGGRSTGTELDAGLGRAFETFLGLHFDQVHGLFFQQPLLLPGLVALGWMIRRRHPLTLPWLMLYASLAVPNALQRIEYGGHVAPAGRFAWSAMWLWLLPLGLAGRELLRHGAGLPSGVRLVVLLGMAYQAALAVQWVPVPGRLFNGLFPPHRWQPSLFASDVMLSLPKFGPHGDLDYPPNLIWPLVAASLVALGLLRTGRLRYVPLAATAAAGCLVLPVEDRLDRSRTVPRRYEAENMPARCSVHPSATASGGRACRQDAERRDAVAGPFVSLEPGAYRFVAAVRQGGGRPPGGGRPSGAGRVQVLADRGGVCIARRDFPPVPSTDWAFVTLEFRLDRPRQDVELRLRGPRGLEVDYVDLHRAGARPAFSGVSGSNEDGASQRCDARGS